MKKAVITVIVIVLVLAIGGAGYFFLLPQLNGTADIGNIAYVASVDNLMHGFYFTSNRYSGVVETQEVIAVEADYDKKVKTTFVKEGDPVKNGDKLFEYDIDEMQIQLDQYQLDIEQYTSEIKAYNDQIASLEREKKTATANRQLTINNEIDSIRLNIKKTEYSKDTTTRNIEKTKRSLANNVVVSTVNGVIQSVNDPQAKGYVTITSNGDYRIKAIISEQNIGEFGVGQRIIIRSRLDDTITWGGEVSIIDTAKPIIDNGTSIVTKYPVYIELDTAENLMVGQHVTIEADLGIDETPKEGVWVDDYYICDADSSPYVWAEGGDGKLAKRTVVLGEYDKDSMKYEITSGLTLEDKIAMPEERLFEGMKVTYNQDDPALNIDMGSNEMTIPIEDMGEISDLTEVGETEASQVSEAG
ncbi:MAG: biotin/lipoyl-binding protein [Acutalibacteraceae bacterium]|nr:biotin/lipoyl-binding protein [Clostridia bacterium]MEE3449503.1 biotin/lipoyl-binding protein [Acutalibacteraceae bacterium]